MFKLPPLLAALAVLAAATAASAGSGRVVVASFTGPEPLASNVRAVVVEIVGARYRLVSDAELDQASEASQTDASEPGAALAIARMTGADAVVVGRVAPAGDSSYALTLSLLRARTGQSAGAFLIPLAAAQVTPAARARIDLLLGNLLAWIDPEAAPPGVASPAPNPAVPAAAPPANAQIAAPPAASGAAPPADVAKKAAVKEEEDKGPAWRFPVVFSAGGGLTATARRLSFSQEPGLAIDASLSSNPTPGLRVEAEAATVGEPGLAVVAAAERSIGAKLSMEDGRTVPVGQKQWELALRGRIRRHRWVPMFTVGYSELRYEADAPPSGYVAPDASYAFLDIGGAVRYELDAATLFASARYLHTLSTSGITDASAFGSARSRGLAGEGGAEVELLDAIVIRAGLRVFRFVLDFEGTGVLASQMDEDSDQDVIGAVDAFIGGYAEAVYRF